MSSGVVGISGAPIGLAGEVDEEIVAALEKMLELARCGGLSGMACVGVMHNREVASAFAVAPTGSFFELLGGVSFLEHQIRVYYDDVD